MPERRRILASWSSGKDSAWMVHQLQQAPDAELVGLLTTFNADADRVAMHAVRRELVELQADRLQLPLWKVPLPFPCSNGQYEARFLEVLADAKEQGITHIAFGDLFLADVREYRTELLKRSGLEALFPIWCEEGEQGTGDLAREMQSTGFEAVTTCIDPQRLPPEFLGQRYDADFLRDLPEGVDPCGERGEFHTFCHAGPIYSQPIPFTTGKRVMRNGFHFLELGVDRE